MIYRLIDKGSEQAGPVVLLPRKEGSKDIKKTVGGQIETGWLRRGAERGGGGLEMGWDGMVGCVEGTGKRVRKKEREGASGSKRKRKRTEGDQRREKERESMCV